MTRKDFKNKRHVTAAAHKKCDTSSVLLHSDTLTCMNSTPPQWSATIPAAGNHEPTKYLLLTI
jgi:hypothetical protein